jgi:SAM-dependent methyltransferase
MFPRMTAVELDPDLASALAIRMAGTSVEVVEADATDLPMADGTFTGAVSFTMFHHVPTPALQDRLFAEVARVLRPGATFVGSDNLDSPAFREAHIDDICTPIDPATLPARLQAAGFEAIKVETNPFAFRFSAVRRVGD